MLHGRGAAATHGATVFVAHGRQWMSAPGGSHFAVINNKGC